MTNPSTPTPPAQPVRLAGAPPPAAEAIRTAFTLTPLHTRRDASRITCVAIDPVTHRVFLGLSNGHIEEHQLLPLQQQQLQPAGGGVAAVAAVAPTSTRLVAEKRVSRSSVVSICCLSVAACLVTRSEDGVVTVTG